MRRPSNKRFTAIHEAAHAVLAVHVGVRVTEVSIVPDGQEGTQGHVKRARLSRRWFDQVEFGGMTQRTHSEAVAHIQVALAGGIAERRARGRWNWKGSRDDRHTAMEYATAVSGSAAEAEALLRYLELRTKAVINNQWELVDAVADLLLERNMLTGAQLRSAINDVRCGRSYGR